MGINEIHILQEPPTVDLRYTQAKIETLILAHQKGEHPDGEKIRECPLCRAGK